MSLGADQKVWLIPTMKKKVDKKNRTTIDGVKLAKIFREVKLLTRKLNTLK